MTAPDPVALVVAALQDHPRRAMTSTELGARLDRLNPAEVRGALAILRERNAVAVHEVLPADRHFPPITAIALIDVPGGTDAAGDAERRARQCAQGAAPAAPPHPPVYLTHPGPSMSGVWSSTCT